MPFVSTPNKDVIRNKYDKSVIQKSKKYGLTYFGLPGINLLDVLVWKDYLDIIIGVERDDIINRQLLLDNVFKNKLKKFQLLTGDIDNILINGKDKYGTTPIEPTFGLVNLDYEGGLLHKDIKGDSKRITAIRKLFERQAIGKRDFLFFVTFNSRNRDEKEFDKTLDQIDQELAAYRVDASNVIDWYKTQRYDLKIKVYFPYLICGLVLGHGFTCNFYHPVTYLGSSNIRMIHFPMNFNYIGLSGRAPSQSLIDLINLPMKEAKNGKLHNVQLPNIELEGK